MYKRQVYNRLRPVGAADNLKVHIFLLNCPKHSRISGGQLEVARGQDDGVDRGKPTRLKSLREELERARIDYYGTHLSLSTMIRLPSRYQAVRT